MTAISGAGLACAIVAAVAVTSTPARADTNFNAGLAAANCYVCHGQRGASTSKIPSLTSLNLRGMSDALKAFSNGTKAGTIMPRIAKGYTDAQLDAIAAHINGQQASK